MTDFNELTDFGTLRPSDRVAAVRGGATGRAFPPDVGESTLNTEIYTATGKNDSAEVDTGVAVGSSSDVAYLMRVGTATGYALESAIHAAGASGLTIAGLQFSKSGGTLRFTDATGDSITVWRVRSVLAIRRLFAQFETTLAGPSEQEASSGIATALRAWSAQRVRQAITAILPRVYQTGDTSRIPAAKLGTGTPDTKRALFNGAWRQPAFDDLTGTAADNQIPAGIARDTEVAAAVADTLTGGALDGSTLELRRRSGQSPVEVNLSGLMAAASGRGLKQLGFWSVPADGAYEENADTGIPLPADPEDDKLFLGAFSFQGSERFIPISGALIKSLPTEIVGDDNLNVSVSSYHDSTDNDLAFVYGARLANGNLLLAKDGSGDLIAGDYFALYDPDGEALEGGGLGGYLWYQQDNPLTTPAFALAAVSSSTSVPSSDADGYVATLLDARSTALVAGAPLTVDYEGALLLTYSGAGRKVVEVSIGYRLFDGVDAKQSTQWRRYLVEVSSGEEISIPADVYSHKQLLVLGVSAPTDGGATYALTAADLQAGVPVKILLRIRGFSRGDLTARSDYEFDHLEWLQPQVVSYQIGLRPDAAAAPSISRFALRGDLSPAAGLIDEDYTATWAVAQSSHLSALRIVRFSGTDAAPAAVTVITNIQAAAFHGGTHALTVSGFSLAADETETVRIEGYGEGQTPATDQPVTYHDVRITAHAPATAAYHWGRIVVAAADADAAATAARVVFASDDLVTGSSLAASYAATPPDSGSDLYQFYLGVADGETEPVGWNSGGLVADAAFQAPVSRTIGGTDYKFWILRASLARESGDGSITYEPRTS